MVTPLSLNTSCCPSLPHSQLLLAGFTHSTYQTPFLKVSFLDTLHPSYQMCTVPAL